MTKPISDRIAAYWQAIDRWFEQHARPCHDQLASSAAASESEIAALERTLGVSLPADLRAHLARYGKDTGATFYEYEGLDVERIGERWSGLERLRGAGTFAAWEPRELDAGESRVQRTWWHGAWVPFAQDGGGNLRCVDLDPGVHGTRGQVIGWELHGGPTRPIAPSFEAYLRRFRDELAAGKLRYDENSGIFDEV